MESELFGSPSRAVAPNYMSVPDSLGMVHHSRFGGGSRYSLGSQLGARCSESSTYSAGRSPEPPMYQFEEDEDEDDGSNYNDWKNSMQVSADDEHNLYYMETTHEELYIHKESKLTRWTRNTFKKCFCHK